MKVIRLGGWGGTRYEPVEVIGETPTRYRVKILNEKAKIAGRNKWASRGDVVLVPKYAIADVPERGYSHER